MKTGRTLGRTVVVALAGVGVVGMGPSLGEEAPLPVDGRAGDSDGVRPDEPAPGRTVDPARDRGVRSPLPTVAVPWSARGTYAVAPGHDPAPGSGRVVRYLVEVERGLPFTPEDFAADVHRYLNDPRGWAAVDGVRFERVDSGPVDLRVSLSSPTLTDRQCLPLRTGGRLSCWNGSRAVLNADRWATATPDFAGRLESYRAYLVNHEVGHALGHDHVGCPGEGELAPVMMQQTKGVGACEPNPWPDPGAILAR